EGFQNLYLRDDTTGALQALTRGPAPSFMRNDGRNGNFLCSSYAGSSADGSHSFFAASAAFTQTGAPVGPGYSLYESSPSGLALVSVLPDGTPAPPQVHGTGFGAESGACTMDQGVIAHAVSADGSKVFWRYGGSYVNGEGTTVQKPLFMRVDGHETVELDAKVRQGVKVAPGPAGKGTFVGASVDGSEVFFTAPGRLLPRMTAEGALYRYDTETRTLTTLTGTATSPQLAGGVGISEDGAYVYFVAQAVLSGGETGAAGETAEPGKDNLYVWHEGEPTRFVARLAGIDEGAWESVPERLTARVSPDGTHLAFLSSETMALSGYDNTVVGGGGCQPGPGESRNFLNGSPLCLEAYIYDADSRTLTC